MLQAHRVLITDPAELRASYEADLLTVSDRQRPHLLRRMELLAAHVAEFPGVPFPTGDLGPKKMEVK